MLPQALEPEQCVLASLWSASLVSTYGAPTRRMMRLATIIAMNSTLSRCCFRSSAPLNSCEGQTGRSLVAVEHQQRRVLPWLSRVVEGALDGLYGSAVYACFLRNRFAHQDRLGAARAWKNRRCTEACGTNERTGTRNSRMGLAHNSSWGEGGHRSLINWTCA